MTSRSTSNVSTRISCCNNRQAEHLNLQAPCDLEGMGKRSGIARIETRRRTMTSMDLSKESWDVANAIVANAITGFAIVQRLVSAHACAKQEIGDGINHRFT